MRSWTKDFYLAVDEGLDDDDDVVVVDDDDDSDSLQSFLDR